MSTEIAPELKTYQGSCHCGAIKFSLTIPEIESVGECNCSICWRKGYAWAFPPAGGLVFEEGKGVEKLTVYEFGGKTMEHRFCPTCGTGVMGKRHNAPAGMDIAVNARTLKGVDVWKIKVNKYDGAALEPRFIPHPFTSEEPTVKVEGGKVYYGSCHCGSTRLAMKEKEIVGDEVEVLECNCSICYSWGSYLIYPKVEQVSLVTSPLHPLIPYSFGRRFQEHLFCPLCGVYIYIGKKNGISLETYRKYGSVKKLDGGDKEVAEDMEEWRSIMPLNLRCFDGLEYVKEGEEEGGKKGGSEGKVFLHKGDWRDALEGVDNPAEA